MYVSPPPYNPQPHSNPPTPRTPTSQSLNQNTHLLKWSSIQAQTIGYKQSIYTLKSLIITNTFQKILTNIDNQYFVCWLDNASTDGCLIDKNHPLDSSSDTQLQAQILRLYKIIQLYMLKQHGKRINIQLRNKITLQYNLQQLLKLLLYLSLTSTKKQQYIERILKLDQATKSTLMKIMEYVSGNVLNIIDQNQVVLRVEYLEGQVQVLKGEIKRVCHEWEGLKKYVGELEDEIQKKNIQIIAYKQQKQKVRSTLNLSTIQDYLTFYQCLQKQNLYLNSYIQELQNINKQYEQNQKQYKKTIEDQSNVICELNQDLILCKERINVFKLESLYRESFQTWCDSGVYGVGRGGRNGNGSGNRRSFGMEISMNQKQNVNCSFSRERSIELDTKTDKDKIRRSLNIPPPSQKQQELLDQTIQLRKHNSDLIQKLENSYKTLNNINIESSLVRQRNQKLQKQNKFYKKKINCLKNLQIRMERDLVYGVI